MTWSLVDQTLTKGGQPLLEHVAPELSIEPAALGVFLVFRSSDSSTRFRATLGRIPALARYVVCHRYEPYWMKPATGSELGRVPAETQFLLARLVDGAWLLIVPLVDDPLRFSLQGSGAAGGEAALGERLELIAETGDATLPASAGTAAYLAVAADPFVMMENAAAEVAARLGAVLRRDKPLPAFVDQFGWCTWDAFYAEVSAENVREGLESFEAGGVQPKLLILDDGWLDVARSPTGEKRLRSFEANQKFPGGLAPLVELCKQRFGIDSFLVWHTIVGYWGGIAPELGYEAIDQVRHFGSGVLAHEPRFNHDWWGELVGYVPTDQVARFFDDFHTRLGSAGVDGVKVDSQAVLEALSQGQGGRVRVSRAYREALESSAARHFAGGLLNCMSNAQETWYFSPKSTLLRSSIDYFPKRPSSHGLHLYTNALVGLWFGEFMHPDWDMFQSAHALGAFHAAGRAVSGGPLYVSDKPGEHDFSLLRKLVCSDGSILRADRPGLPTPDSLLVDPSQERTLLKIWSRNGCAALVGAFHCFHDPEGKSEPIEGSLGPGDVPGLAGEQFAVFAHQAQRLSVLSARDEWPLRLLAGGFELVTLVPIVDDFAAIGLADKYNSRGAVARESASDGRRELDLRDGGHFLAYSRRKPRRLVSGDAPSYFDFDAETCLLSARLALAGPQRLLIEW